MKRLHVGFKSNYDNQGLQNSEVSVLISSKKLKMLKSSTKVMSGIKLKLEINKMFYFSIVLAFKVL